jgi:NAD(P)-dependent dehydrogenase (short-subunit alcohol dehydrogenase family)
VVDILVINALFQYQFDPNYRLTIDHIRREQMQDQIDGTLKGAFHCIQAVVPKMKERVASWLLDRTHAIEKIIVLNTGIKGAIHLGKYFWSLQVMEGGIPLWNWFKSF